MAFEIARVEESKRRLLNIIPETYRVLDTNYDFRNFLYSIARVYEGLRNLTENFETMVDPRRMRLDLLEYYARNFGFEIDREDLGSQRAFVDLAAQYVGIKGTKNSFKSLLRSYGIKSDVSELYISDFVYAIATDGDIQLTNASDEIKQKRIERPGGTTPGKLIVPADLRRTYVRITGDTAYLNYYSPFGVQVISIGNADIPALDNGEFVIDYAIYDGTYTRVYVKNHNFLTNDDDVIVQFKDMKRSWLRVDEFGAKYPGTMWIGDSLNILRTTSTTSLLIGTGAKALTVGLGLSYVATQKIIIRHDLDNEMLGTITSYNSGTGALVVNVTDTVGAGTYDSWVVFLGPFKILDLWFDTDGLPKAKLDSSMAATEVIDCEELPTLSSGAPVPADYEITPQPGRIGRYNDPFAMYNNFLLFDEKIDSPFVFITNRFLIRFLEIPDISVLTDEVLDRITRRVNTIKPIGSEFDGFSYRVGYLDSDKVNLTTSQYDSVIEMCIGTEMSGEVAFDGTVDTKKINGTGTKFRSEISAGDFIMVGTGIANPPTFVSTVTMVQEVVDDVTLLLVDSLPVQTKSGLKIAKRVYLKRVFKYQTGSGASIKHFIRSDIPSSDFIETMWPSGITEKITMTAVTENFVSGSHIDPIFSLSVDPAFVKPDRATIFFLFEIGLP